MKYFLMLIFILHFVYSCSSNRLKSLKPAGYEKFQYYTVKEGNLEAIFIDNSEMEPHHRAGYNGIAELYHIDQDSSVFSPTTAGFNLEHIFSGDTLEQFYEPRVSPMVLYKKSNNEVLLYQEATPFSGAETLTEFKVVEPHYIDVTFRCILHDKQYFRHGYAGFFWASYIHGPSDRNIYFQGFTKDDSLEKWISAFSEIHGIESTHRNINDEYDFNFVPDFRIRLASNFSDYRFSSPFYYGLFNNMILAFFFESSEIIRFTQSPSGGGRTAGGRINPAWDFQYIIPDVKTGQEYSFKARIVYKLFINNDDIIGEYEKWKSNLKIN